MIGEGGVDVITKPVDFKITPEVPRPKNFTPLPEFGRSIITEPPKFEDPTDSMSPQDKELTNRLMAQIMDKPESKKPQEVVQQIEKKIPIEAKKSQGFWAKISEVIKDFFKNFFR